MLKLFAVLLGGRAEGCNTELHDVVFTAGSLLEDTYPNLVNKWFGSHKRLHIDSVIELRFIDGHEVIISKNKPDNHDSNSKKLFFVNFGGYKPGYFGEVHEVNFYVGQSKSDVLARSKSDLGLSLLEPHCDDNIVVDDIFAIDTVDNYYIHLLPTASPPNLTIKSGYFRLDVPEIIEKAKTLTKLDMAY